MSLIPIIQIDSSKARNLDISIDLQKIYYQPSGYQRTAKKLHEASLKAGFDFTLNEVHDWLERQAVHQVHKSRPRNIPSASFINVTIPMEVIQADLCYMPYDQIGNKIYKFALNCVDIATRTKWTYPLTKRDSVSVAIGLEKLFNSQKCPLTWPKKDLMVDGGVEFRGDVIRLMNKYGINILIANSKESMGIVERFNKTLQEWSSIIQDAVDMRLPISERCRAWVRNLPIFLENLDNSVTRLLGISPADARKLKHVYAKPSKPRNGPMGFDEKQLTYNVLVRYLLKPGELEGGRRRAGDMNWSPQVYHICESLVQKNQPVLYWLEDDKGNSPKRSFVRERLMVIKEAQLPPRWVLSN